MPKGMTHKAKDLCGKSFGSAGLDAQQWDFTACAMPQKGLWVTASAVT
jgi:hypothetical protein